MTIFHRSREELWVLFTHQLGVKHLFLKSLKFCYTFQAVVMVSPVSLVWPRSPRLPPLRLQRM